MRPVFCLTLLPIAALLSGCVTTQGGGLVGVSDSLLKPLGMNTSSVTDSFSSEIRTVRQLVEAGKLDEAEVSFLKEAEYFKKRLSDESKALPAFLQVLGEHVWRKHYAQRVADTQQQLASVVDVTERTKWAQYSKALSDGQRLIDALDQDLAVALLRQGSDERSALRAQVLRVNALAHASRGVALAATHDEVLSTGSHSYEFPAKPFDASDYIKDTSFQEAIRRVVDQQNDRASLAAFAGRLGPYMGDTTKAATDERFVSLVRRELLADGQVSLEEMGTLSAQKTPFGGATDKLSGVVKVGYVDLTSANLRNRNAFDFEIAFKKDLTLTFASADESVFRSGNWGAYDYLFITDLAVAKVSRDFKSRKPVRSRAKTGERQTPNPAYVDAVSNYQKAMAEFQRVQIEAAIPKACQGWGCALQGLADGLAQGTARSRVDEASRTLGSTSQTLTVPVYSDYAYESVDINAVKSVDVNYYVVDVKGRRIIRSSFQVNDQENFNVAYNVRDEDPDKASILRNLKAEEEVTAWEKRPVEVPLSALFNSNNLQSASATPLTDVPSFLASLSNRQVVAAAPTYARGGHAAGGAAASTGSSGTSQLRDSSSSSSQTIADERFDSIVIVQSPGSTGTGFYVTPELILTAHHVVEKNALVQLVMYNGTKTYGRVVDHDVRLDLALVRAQTVGKPLKIHTGPLRLGETVEAIGHPKGYEFTITRGVVSALRRQRSANIGSNVPVEFVQTDTPISPGNSGGPLLLGDVVIGVNDWIRVDKGSQNLNFSVSYNEIREFLSRTQAK